MWHCCGSMIKENARQDMGTRRKSGKKGRGRWQVERERHQLEQQKPYMSFKDASPIDEAMQRVMKRIGIADQHWLEALSAEWGTLVGEAVARHTRPGRFQKKNLTVFVDSSVWLNELSRYGRKEMLAKLQERFGEGKVRSISLKLDPEGQGARNG